MKRILNRFAAAGKAELQRLFIALEFFDRNALTNHAAAGAHGFLLSAAPVLLLVSFFLLAAFRSSPGAVSALIKNISFLEIVFDEAWFNSDFLALSRPGISGIISVVSIVWAGRVFAVALQRGLKIIFSGTKKRNPVLDKLVALAIELLVLIFALVMILGSQTALHLYEILNFLPEDMFGILSKFRFRIFPVITLGLISYCAYCIIPANAPRRLSALRGAIFCVLSYEITALALRIMLNQTRYNFLYGALGGLIVLLINVYFFFIFFFFGAQLAFVADYFDALLFSRLRQSRTVSSGHSAVSGVMRKLFSSTDGNLKKYLRRYQKGEIILSEGDSGSDIYYLLEGEIEVFIKGSGNPVSGLGPFSFFGEMGYLLSEDRSATIKAKTDAAALVLPPGIFDEVLKYDAGMERTIIEHLSRRLKTSNKQIAANS